MIAQDAGITSGAIYHYVESKAELYADVYCSTVDHLYSEFEQAASEHDTLFDQYGAVLRRAAELSLDDPSITGFIVAVTEETRRHPDLLALMTPQRGRHARFFAGLVEAAHERGELAPDLDLRALTDLLGSVMTGLARMSHAAGDASRYTAAVEDGRHVDVDTVEHRHADRLGVGAQALGVTVGAGFEDQFRVGVAELTDLVTDTVLVDLDAFHVFFVESIDHH
ncbi:unnamed protein product, partial [Symbiodinium sp. KB8]